MVLRIWKARANPEGSRKYFQHAAENVFPALREMEGHAGAYCVSRRVEGAVEIMVLTFWDSMEAIRKFAGANPEKAVVAAEAEAVLTEFDDFVTHYEVLDSTAPAAFAGR